MSNEYGTVAIPITPGEAVVHRSANPLTIDCAKGLLKGSAIVTRDTESSRETWSLVGGGMIGRSVDRDSGAAYAYPDSVEVILQK